MKNLKTLVLLILSWTIAGGAFFFFFAYCAWGCSGIVPNIAFVLFATGVVGVVVSIALLIRDKLRSKKHAT
jgi:hypothetical protein